MPVKRLVRFTAHVLLETEEFRRGSHPFSKLLAAKMLPSGATAAALMLIYTLLWIAAAKAIKMLLPVTELLGV